MSTPYLFILGRTPDLALVELQSVYPDFHITSLHPRVIKVDDLCSVVPSDVIAALGGITKIAKIIGVVPSITPEVLATLLMEPSGGTSIVFGLSSFVDLIKVSRTLLTEVKKILEASGNHVRFVESKQGDELSSVVVEKQHITELLIAKADNSFIIARTDAVQDFEDWNKRDYARPYADPKSGMLPPKVARMVVNVASYYTSFWQVIRLSRRARPESPSDAGQFLVTPGAASMTGPRVLLDPFCGMGTILAEALVTKWNVVGSDQSADVIHKAQKNIEWLKTVYPKISHIPCEFITEEATHIGNNLKKESIDAIVTEPFMGRQEQKMDGEKMKNVIKGLEKLYIGCFKEWYNLLKPNGVVVIALPEYVNKDKVFFVKKVVDNCENLGYTRLVGPITYSRPQAVVRRNFYVFQKKLKLVHGS